MRKRKLLHLNQLRVLVLENLRYEAGETKNDATFAQELADIADIYINDAFGACHRAHASIDAMTKLFDSDHKAAGFLHEQRSEFLFKST